MKRFITYTVAHAALNLNAHTYSEGIQQLRHDTYISDLLVEPASDIADGGIWAGCSSTDGPICFSGSSTAAQLADGFFSQRLIPEGGYGRVQSHTVGFPAKYGKAVFFDGSDSAPREMKRHRSKAVCSEIDFLAPFREANGVHYKTEPPFPIEWRGIWRTTQAAVNGTRKNFSALEIQSSFASIKFDRSVALMSVTIARRCPTYHLHDATPLTIIGRNEDEEIFSETVHPWELTEVFVNGVYYHATTQAQSITELWFLMAECVQIKSMRFAHSPNDESRRAEGAFLLAFRDGWKAFDVQDMTLSEVVDHNAPLWSLHEVVDTNRRLFHGVIAESPGNLVNSTNAENKLGIASPFPVPAEREEWSGAYRSQRKFLDMLNNWNPVYERGVDMLALILELTTLLQQVKLQGEHSILDDDGDAFTNTWRHLRLPNLTVVYYRYTLARRRGTAKRVPGVFDVIFKTMARRFQKETRMFKSSSLQQTLAGMVKKIFSGTSLSDGGLLSSSTLQDAIKQLKAVDVMDADDDTDMDREDEPSSEPEIEGTDEEAVPRPPEGTAETAVEAEEAVAVKEVEPEKAMEPDNKVAQSLDERLASLEDANPETLDRALNDHVEATKLRAPEGQRPPAARREGISELAKKIKGVIAEMLGDISNDKLKADDVDEEVATEKDDEEEEDDDDQYDDDEDDDDEEEKEEEEEKVADKKAPKAKASFDLGIGIVVDGKVEFVTGSTVEEVMQKIKAHKKPELDDSIDELQRAVQSAFDSAEKVGVSSGKETNGKAKGLTPLELTPEQAAKVFSANEGAGMDAEQLANLFGASGGDDGQVMEVGMVELQNGEDIKKLFEGGNFRDLFGEGAHRVEVPLGAKTKKKNGKDSVTKGKESAKTGTKSASTGKDAKASAEKVTQGKSRDTVDALVAETLTTLQKRHGSEKTQHIEEVVHMALKEQIVGDAKSGVTDNGAEVAEEAEL